MSRPRRGYRFALPIALASLVLGLSLSICAADILIPLFWERRSFIVTGFLSAAGILQAVWLFPVLKKFARHVVMAATPTDRFSWIFASTALVSLSLFVIWGAWGHQAAVATLGLRHHRSYPAADYATEFAFLFALAVFLGMVHADFISQRLNAEQRIYFALGFLSLCFLGIYFANNLLPAIRTSAGLQSLNFNLPHGFVSILPVGDDFRGGIYLPAQRLASGSAPYFTIYPPLVALLGLPYLLFPETGAYVLHVSMLVVANVLVLALAALLARKCSPSEAQSASGDINTICLTVFLLVAFNGLSSYPFLFSMERGNIDIFAILFSLGSIGLLLRFPNRIWYQVALLSIAVHIKIYPVFLFALLFAVNGRRVVVPALFVNLALLLILGPTAAIAFVGNLMQYYHGYAATFNHSAYSFAELLTIDFPSLFSGLPTLRIAFLSLPFLIWIVAWRALLRISRRERIAAAAFMISVPLMAILPPMSYDYQLVILSSAVLILLSRVLLGMTARQTTSDYLQLLAISILVLLIGRSDALIGSSLGILQDKYLWVVLLQMLMLFSILRELHESSTVDPRTV